MTKVNATIQPVSDIQKLEHNAREALIKLLNARSDKPVTPSKTLFGLMMQVRLSDPAERAKLGVRTPEGIAKLRTGLAKYHQKVKAALAAQSRAA